jgi:dethiobiotin synthetase
MPRPRGFFIAGTDTGVGKSLVAVGLIKALINQRLRVAGMKPVAAGSEMTELGLRNDDALALRAASNVDADYVTTNPYCLPAPVSPHIAARETGVIIDIAEIVRSFEQLASRADCVVVEGAGGWLAPINDTQTMADIAQALGLPVILVVGLRLGCLNHALLSAQSISASGLALSTWVGSHVDPEFSRPAENLQTLQQRLGLAPAAIIPYSTNLVALAHDVPDRLRSFAVSF